MYVSFSFIDVFDRFVLVVLEMTGYTKAVILFRADAFLNISDDESVIFYLR